MQTIILDKNLDPSAFLWRYIDLHKLLSFISTDSIPFTRIDLFSDKLEGTTAKHLEELWFLNEAPDPVHDLNLDQPNPVREERQNLAKKEQEGLELYQQSTFVSCWFLGTRESVAMWNLYSNPDSVVIKINAAKLIKAISSSAQSNSTRLNLKRLIAGKVKYKDLIGYNPLVDLLTYGKSKGISVKYKALRKDESYRHENEYRFIIEILESTSNPVILIPIYDIETTGIEIVFHPKMQEWKKENIKKFILPQQRFKIKNSEVAAWIR